MKTAEPEKIPENIKSKLLIGNHKEAINEAYKMVDNSITKGAQFGLFTKSVPYQPAQKAEYLVEQKVLTKDQADVFNTLSTIQLDLNNPKLKLYTDPSSGWNYASQAVGLAKEIDDTWSVIEMKKKEKSGIVTTTKIDKSTGTETTESIKIDD
ncbi:MAG: hypothetical protein MJE63_26625 [Proteobacteria bacterium]|nr:hypothetical protein [Pseudomonadota bacterium]